jgi:hypothetical protein
MRVTIWVTEHSYSQRVCSSIKAGFKDSAVLATPIQYSDDTINATDVHIGYGVIRGMGEVYARIGAAGKHWFNVDLGYFDARHFDGQYRIAHMGTQNKFDATIQAPTCPDMDPWKTDGEFALICPPTEQAAHFFKIDEVSWLEKANAQAGQFGLKPKIRRKGDTEHLDDAFASAGCIIAFNSSVAWKALQLGIPAISDIQHSTVGSWHGDVASLDAIKKLNRERLFRFMVANQLSLLDMQQGKLLPILKRYLPAA